ncbi:MAG: isochorismatase family cysteine hydrolase [Pseudonocardiaceae bacterium]
MNERKPVLVVVDVQNGFITEHSQPVVPVIVDLVRRWQAAHGDMVFTRYLNYPGSPFEKLIGWTKMTASPQTEIIPELLPYIDPQTPVIDKYIYTLFTPEGTKLVDERGWTDLYVCGIDTEICVLKTAVDAFEHNLTPWILEDASASHSGPKAHAAGLFIAGRFIGMNQIIQTASLGSLLSLPT